VGQDPSVLWAKNHSGHVMEDKDHPSVARLIFIGYLGGQTSEMARTTNFQAKSVCYNPQFWGWAWGLSVLWDKN